MKKILICLSMLLTMALTSVTAHAIAGDGSGESPFIITTQEELSFINDFPTDNFVLGSDIVLTGTWEPLCTYADDFTGTLDGAGYTISDLSLKNISYTGLFKTNKGTIKNLTVKTVADGFTLHRSYTYDAGLIACNNYGTISNCHVSGKIILDYSYRTSKYGTDYYYTNIGSVAYYNYGKIEYTTSDVDISTTQSISTVPEVGGIAYYNASGATISNCASKGSYTGNSGGIVYSNSGTISNCYFIGKAQTGIAYENSSGAIENCYSAAENSYSNYGILVSNKNSGTATNCFYDRNLTSSTSTAYAAPKTTMAMKMKRTFTSVNWDFNTIWGIDADINYGYPYLLWEHPDAVPSDERYTLNSITLKDIGGTKITAIPDGSFYVEVLATKNDNKKAADSLVIAAYDEDDTLLDIKFMSGEYYQNQTVCFGARMTNKNGQIASLRAFIWDSIDGMLPLSNAIGNN